MGKKVSSSNLAILSLYAYKCASVFVNLYINGTSVYCRKQVPHEKIRKVNRKSWAKKWIYYYREIFIVHDTSGKGGYYKKWTCFFGKLISIYFLQFFNNTNIDNCGNGEKNEMDIVNFTHIFGSIVDDMDEQFLMQRNSVRMGQFTE